MLEAEQSNRPDFKQILDKLPDYNDIKIYFKGIENSTPGDRSGATTDRDRNQSIP
jgi:hypothetical protein